TSRPTSTGTTSSPILRSSASSAKSSRLTPLGSSDAVECSFRASRTLSPTPAPRRASRYQGGASWCPNRTTTPLSASHPVCRRHGTCTSSTATEGSYRRSRTVACSCTPVVASNRLVKPNSNGRSQIDSSHSQLKLRWERDGETDPRRRRPEQLGQRLHLCEHPRPNSMVGRLRPARDH